MRSRPSGFRIKHLVRDEIPWSLVEDEYVLTFEEPVRIGSVRVE
jgi:hypothetical protein